MIVANKSDRKPTKCPQVRAFFIDQITPAPQATAEKKLPKAKVRNLSSCFLSVLCASVVSLFG